MFDPDILHSHEILKRVQDDTISKELPAIYSLPSGCARSVRHSCNAATIGINVRWWAVQDSNLRPPVCKTDALPAELTALRTVSKFQLML